MSAVIQHRGDGAANLAQQLVLDNDECNACHSQVLLCAAVNHAVFAYVDWTREYIRTHVGNQGYGAVEVLENFGAVDCVVGGNMEIVGIRWNFPTAWNVVVGLVCAACHLDCFTKQLCLGHGFLRPYAGIQIGGLLLQEVVWNHAEFQACATTQEQYAVAFRNVQQLLEQSYGFIYHGLEVLGTMTHFHQGETGALKLDTSIRNSLHDFFWQFGRTGIEIVLFHNKCI